MARLDPLQAVEVARQGRIGDDQIPVLGGQHARSRFDVGGIGEACRATSLEGAPQREGFRLVAIQKQYLQQLVGCFLYDGQPRPVRVKNPDVDLRERFVRPLVVPVVVLAETDVPPGQHRAGLAIGHRLPTKEFATPNSAKQAGSCTHSSKCGHPSTPLNDTRYRSATRGLPKRAG